VRSGPVGSPASARVVDAVVQSGGVETPYRRGGSGPAVLLLTRRSGEIRDRVFARLAGTNRVIEPLSLPPVSRWPDWLRGVVDGLGLDRPDLVVDPELESGVLELLRGDPDRYGRLVRIDTLDP
jgi:hypothetical protein